MDPCDEMIEDWLTAEVERLRKRLHDVETICDPAGDQQTIANLREDNGALIAEVARLRAKVERLRKEQP
jgi:regulator of replication initiation timing